MKPKTLCVIGLFFFVTSYLLFSQGSEFAFAQKPIDFAHWFNLIGAILLISFNYVFPKGTLNSIASALTSIGVIAHIGLCTIDFIIWSFGNDNVSRDQFINHINNTPSIFYPFIVIGPSLFFIGLSLHGWNFIRTYPLPSIMVILGPSAIGYSYFMLNNLTYTAVSCLVFAIGLILLLYREKKVFNVF